MGEIATLAPRNESPLGRARRLRDEARDAAMAVAEALSGEAAQLADRCAELSKIDSLPGGLRDAFLKLAMELESRNQSIGQIMAAVR